MKPVALIVLVAAAALAVFAALNWNALNATAPVYLGLATVEAAPGVIVLAFAFGFALALLAYAAWYRTTQLLEARRHAQDLRDLRAEIASGFEATRRTIEESTNGLSASLGHLDDKLDARPAQARLTPP
jgi:hypothetical protein